MMMQAPTMQPAPMQGGYPVQQQYGGMPQGPPVQAAAAGEPQELKEGQEVEVEAQPIQYT